MKIASFLLTLFTIVLATLMSAYSKPLDPVVSNCKETPILNPSHKMPPFIYQSNNLRRDAGKGHIAEGEPITIHGRFFDKNCTPVAGATVEIWQANSHGVYQGFDDPVAEDVYDPHFLNSGTSITDNLGHFHFVTVMPGIVEEAPNAPRIHLRIIHPYLPKFATELFFDTKKELNQQDGIYNYLQKDKRNLVLMKSKDKAPENKEFGHAYYIDITHRKATWHRSY